MRQIDSLVFAIVLDLLGGSVAGVAQEPAQHPFDSLSVTTARVRELQRELRHEHGSCIDSSCIETRMTAVRTVLQEYTVEMLNNFGGDTSRLLSDLRAITAPPEPGTAEPPSSTRVFRQQSSNGVRIVTINVVGYGPLATLAGAVIIQGFRKQGDRYVFAAEIGEDLSGPYQLDAEVLQQSARPQEIWILAHGRIVGSSRNLIRAAIYSFDGYRFQEMWHPSLKEDLRLRPRQNEVDVYYVERQPRTGFDEVVWVHETLSLTASGVVESARENLGPTLPYELRKGPSQ